MPVKKAGISIQIKVLFFASAREAAGDVSSADLELGAAGADTRMLRTCLAERYPKLAPMVLDEENLTLALNEEYVLRGQVLPLKNGDTVALIPPISGG
jgi:molybdopterin converting factor subunit 1